MNTGDETGDPGSSPSGDPTTDRPTSDWLTTDWPTTDSPEISVDAELEAVQPALVELVSPDSVGVAREDRQYVYFRVEADDPAPAREAFGLRFDGQTHQPANLDDYRLYREYSGSNAYTASTGSGWLLFALPPTGDAGTAALTWPGGEFALPEPARQQLASERPALSVSLDAPETAAVGEAPPLSVTVTNEGSTPGQFVAGVTRIGPRVAYIPLARISERVPAGESTTIPIPTESLDSPGEESLGDGKPDVRYVLTWVDGDREAEIRVQAD